MSISLLSRLPGSVKLGVPLAAVALLAAACSSSGSTAAQAGSAPASSASSASTAGGGTANGTATDTVISTTSGSAGKYLVSGSGRALYMWVADSKDKSVCSGACAGAWPPVLATGKVVAQGGAEASELGTITRTGGAKQVTYNGWPLYYYVGDPSAGTTTGQGSDSFGAKWWLLTPSGAEITATTTSSTSSSSSSSSSSGGGW